MAEVSRLSADKVREGVVAGTTLLVCAYDDDAKFKKFKLEGAIALSDFKMRLSDLRKDMQVVFYCA